MRNFALYANVVFKSTFNFNHLRLSGRLPKFLLTQIAPSFSVVSYNTPFILASHLFRTSSYMNFFWIQWDFILYKKKTHPFFFYCCLRFYFISLFFILIFLIIINFFFVFRDVPECSMFLVLSTAVKKRFESILIDIVLPYQGRHLALPLMLHTFYE